MLTARPPKPYSILIVRDLFNIFNATNDIRVYRLLSKPLFLVYSYGLYLELLMRATLSALSTINHVQRSTKRTKEAINSVFVHRNLRIKTRHLPPWRMLTKNTMLKICSTYLRNTTLLQSASLDFWDAILCHVLYHSDMADL
jgi:hypothetical protein